MRRCLLTALLALAVVVPAARADGPTVRFDTSLGVIDVRLFPDDAPNTVATFLRYVDAHSYDHSYFHRSVRNFVIQGGGYTQVDGESKAINELIADGDPFKRSNQRGTIAVARLPGQPNRSTSQWFFNQSDNASLDTSTDNYTVFGRVNDRASLAVMDAIGALSIIDGSGGTANSAFSELPVRNYAGGALKDENLVFVNSITVVPGSDTPYAVPFKLRKSFVKVKRAKRKLRVTVKRLPAGTNVAARLKGRTAVAAAPKGTAKLTLPRRTGKLKITATVPGGRATSVTIKIG